MQQRRGVCHELHLHFVALIEEDGRKIVWYLIQSYFGRSTPFANEFEISDISYDKEKKSFYRNCGLFQPIKPTHICPAPSEPLPFWKQTVRNLTVRKPQLAEPDWRWQDYTYFNVVLKERSIESAYEVRNAVAAIIGLTRAHLPLELIIEIMDLTFPAHNYRYLFTQD